MAPHPSKQPPGVIFDLDGTLIDTLDDITDSINAVFEADGQGPVPRERVRELIGEGLRTLLERASGIDDPQRYAPDETEPFVCTTSSCDERRLRRRNAGRAEPSTDEHVSDESQQSPEPPE